MLRRSWTVLLVGLVFCTALVASQDTSNPTFIGDKCVCAVPTPRPFECSAPSTLDHRCGPEDDTTPDAVVDPPIIADIFQEPPLLRTAADLPAPETADGEEEQDVGNGEFEPAGDHASTTSATTESHIEASDSFIPPKASERLTSSSATIQSSTASSTSSHTSDKASSPILLSFEEWRDRFLRMEEAKKEKQKQQRQAVRSRGKGQNTGIKIDSLDGGFGDDVGAMFEGSGQGWSLEDTYFGQKSKGDVLGDLDHDDEAINVDVLRRRENADHHGAPVREEVNPLKKLKDRYNYASVDCAATILSSNKDAKGAHSVLSESKDMYMLNKCDSEKFLIVDLCEEVLIDSIVLANFEFFSSTFRDFRVSVSNRYPPKEWIPLGNWTARNTRDLQVFQVEDGINWFQYMKIEFLTHYGREYYCPLSLLRVYGTPQYEYYNVVEKPKMAGDEEDEPMVAVVEEVTTSGPIRETEGVSEHTKVESPMSANTGATPTPNETDSVLEQLEALDKRPLTTGLSGSLNTLFPSSSSAEMCETLECLEALFAEPRDGSSVTTANTFTVTTPAVSFPSQTTLPSSEGSADNPVSSSTQQRSESSLASSISFPTSSIKSEPTGTNTDALLAQLSKALNSGSGAGPQESIYKTIMKRLALLELNATLSQRYLEEQNKMLQELFIKVDDRQKDRMKVVLSHLNDTATRRIDRLRRKYEQLYQTTLVELATSQDETAKALANMNNKLHIMADELLFEKRLTFIQLLLLLILFGSLALTRGTLSAFSPIVAAQQTRQRRQSLALDPFEQASPKEAEPETPYFYHHPTPPSSAAPSPSPDGFREQEDDLYGTVKSSEVYRAHDPGYSVQTPILDDLDILHGRASPADTASPFPELEQPEEEAPVEATEREEEVVPDGELEVSEPMVTLYLPSDTPATESDSFGSEEASVEDSKDK
ncbi:hypothetical protein BZG36_02726 [Bifiguratus adelaidae]|uniref:SUN-like protein 1 n=1 Tax=Bifiguratus adelaidae TaxID=1938954 RepID=A0A261XYT6_9FUNG|nr:hypothetical protein BZG36_02726 [Bifiguratus adelaidae]